MTVGAALASGFTIPIYNQSQHNLAIALSCWAVLGCIALIVWMGLILKKQKTNTENIRHKLPLGNKKAIQITLFFGFMASMFYSMTAWIAPIALNFGFSQQYSAWLLTVFTLIQIPSALLIPSIANRFGKTKLLLVLCSLSELIGLGLLLFSSPMLPAVLLLGIGAGGLFPLALMLPIKETSTAEEAGAWSAMSQMGGYIMGAFGPLSIGWIFDLSGNFYTAIIAMIITVVLMIGIHMSMSLSSKVSEKTKTVIR